MFVSHDSVRALFSYPDQNNRIQAHDGAEKSVKHEWMENGHFLYNL